MYKDIWTLFVDEILHAEQEDNNPEDYFAVCIVKGSAGGDNIVGHMPREVFFNGNFLPPIYNVTSNSVALIELTCPLDSTQHLEAARDHKQSKYEYLQILSELDRLGVPSIYDTVYWATIYLPC